MNMLKLQWAQTLSLGWFILADLPFASLTDKGVYVIWHAGNPGRYVRVGQGIIGERLECHNGEPKILAYGKFGVLHVTWAIVPAHQRDGVERHLAETLKPLVGERFPLVAPIPVNLPGEAA